MTENTLTWQQKLNLMYRIGDVYRSSRRRLDIEAAAGRSIRTEALRDDLEMKMLMERTLADCCPNTRLITTKDFLEIPRKGWYRMYFSQSQYYRLKHKAVDEFLHCLDLA